ncbi:hypothetical protein PJL18_03070 [Paenarthrobacter nicotinovorans]|nr:hypothetical protein [Paenarthrobacter nicotinovorans]
MPARSPYREVSSGGVAQCHHFAELEVVVPGYLRQVVDPGQDVLERMGPSTAVPGAPVFKVPGGDSVRCEVPRQRFAELRAVLRAPVAAMDHNGYSTGHS